MTYAISFDLDAKTLQDSYPNPSWQNAFLDIERALREYGFVRKQGSVYFGDDTLDVVRCRLPCNVSLSISIGAPSVPDIRMLRIEDNNDLMPAIELVMNV